MGPERTNRRARGVKFFEDFHSSYGPKGHRPGVRRARGVPPRPSILAELGELEAVTYRANKGDGKLVSYEHMFGEEGGRRPVLAADVDRKRLHVLGGDYTIEPRGIVD